MHLPNRLAHRSQGRIFYQITPGSGVDGFENISFVGVRREHEHFGGGTNFENLLCGLTPDEHAVRSDARSVFDTISAAIPARDRELYSLLLGLHETGTRAQIEAYASRMGIAVSTVYDRLKKLGAAIQLHPMVAGLAAAFRPQMTA